MSDTSVPPTTDMILATHNRRGWLISAVLLIFGVVYMSAFWGRGARHLPAPLDRWAFFYSPYVRPWWLEHVLLSWPKAQRLGLLWLTANVTLGLVVPAITLRFCGIKLREVGLGLPNRIGGIIMVVGIVLSIPFGLWLSVADHKLGIKGPLTFFHLTGALSMIPEHFLICGTYVALMLPGRRLPLPVRFAPIEGSGWRRGLRRLGLAQPPLRPGHNRILAWFGLTGTSLAAILVSGLLFFMVHIGKGTTELILSFPGGVAVAYMTLRSGSIWPAILAHMAMTAIPMSFWTLVR